MPKFRKKPVVIEAIRFTGHNDEEIERFVGAAGFDPPAARPTFIIHTLEGDMTAEVGDWVIKGVNGEFYPCKPDVFQKTYEPVEE